MEVRRLLMELLAGDYDDAVRRFKSASDHHRPTTFFPRDTVFIMHVYSIN
jgi:hypothetical protein